jgi:hypothetical protein
MKLNATYFSIPEVSPAPFSSLADQHRGKIYADVPLSFFASIDDLKKYIIELKDIGVNVLLILPHFLPSLSPYVVKDYQQPCPLFGNWENFAELMKFVEDLGMDRMIDIPFNHADFNALHLRREWFKDHENDGIEAGADDVDADNNRIRINWGAFILDNSLEELQNYWLENVIFPHVEKYHINAIRIDAAWGLDPAGLARIVGETRQRFPNVWFLAENLGMAPLIKLAESGIAAGADRFFNNIYWYSGGLYIPTDIYTLYKRSNGVPTCTIYSSHDVLMPAMKALARIRADEVQGLNDKAIVRKFVQYEDTHSLAQLDADTVAQILALMKIEFALAALMSSDVMFAAGSEKGLFERIDVCNSGPENFAAGISSDLPEFMRDLLKIKQSDLVFNQEGTVIPFGCWKPDQTGLKGYVKTCKDGRQALVCVNTDADQALSLRLPKRIRTADNLTILNAEGSHNIAGIADEISLNPYQIMIITCNRSKK